MYIPHSVMFMSVKISVIFILEVASFLGVGKNFRLLMQSCCFFCFFFSRPFHENFKFLKNCPYDLNKILQIIYTILEQYMCNGIKMDVRNIAKISPKMAKKQSFFDFFSIISKTASRFKRNFLQLFYCILES